MIALYVWGACIALFAGGALVLGLWLRGHPSRENAERASRIMHFLFFACLSLSTAVVVFYPGITHLDAVVGLRPLSPWPLFLILGIALAVPGTYLLAVSNALLRRLGSGANVFRLTRTVVKADIYRATRNPMSLGYYLFTLAFGLITGSSVFTLGVLVGIIPAHIFCLRYFEELELELRLGERYREYRESTPFLIPDFRRDARRTSA